MNILKTFFYLIGSQVTSGVVPVPGIAAQNYLIRFSVSTRLFLLT
jgi:hypothetical protein